MQGIILQYFHWYLPADGNLWKQLKKDARKLRRLGFTSIWFPPAYKGASGGMSVGYDPYDLFDLGEFDQKGSVRTKYGTRKEYLDAVDAVHHAGMRVMVDIVLNHKSGGDETEKIKVVKVDQNNRTKVISAPFEIEAFTKFTFPVRAKKYSAFQWDYMCFTGVDFAKDLNESGIFRILNGNGDSWQEEVSEENGNYDFLMYDDIDFRNPAVCKELSDWSKWYWYQRNFDSVRLDAVKHIPSSFYLEWLKELRQSTGQEMFAVGEYWAPGFLNLMTKYIEETKGEMSLFDASLQDNFHNASERGNHYDMRKILDETLVKVIPEKAVTIVSNHDTQPLQALEAPVEAWFRPIAYAIILLREQGYPSVFYPDLYGAHYKDKGNDGNEYEIWLAKVHELPNLIRARDKHAYGTQRDYFDHANCIGWTREGDDKHSGCAVLISNSEAGFKKMEIGKRYVGKKFSDMLGKFRTQVEIGEDGWGVFQVKAGSVSVWVQK